MSIFEEYGVKCLDTSSLKEIPEELKVSPKWEILEFKVQRNGTFYKLQGRSNNYYQRPKGLIAGFRMHYCDLLISNDTVYILESSSKIVE